MAQHFTTGAGGPTLDERMERLGGMHERLGAITVERIEAFDDGSVEMRVRTMLDGPGVLRFDVAPGSPPRIRRLMVMMGG